MSKMAHSSLIYSDESTLWHMIIDAKVGYLHMVQCEYIDDNIEAKVFEIGYERYFDLTLAQEEG